MQDIMPIAINSNKGMQIMRSLFNGNFFKAQFTFRCEAQCLSLVRPCRCSRRRAWIIQKLNSEHLPPIFHHNATSWDNGCQKRPLLTPFLTPVAPRRARDRVPSILALGLISRSPKTGSPPLPSPPLSIYRLSPNRKLQSKNGTPPFLHF